MSEQTTESARVDEIMAAGLDELMAMRARAARLALLRLAEVLSVVPVDAARVAACTAAFEALMNPKL